MNWQLQIVVAYFRVTLFSEKLLNKVKNQNQYNQLQSLWYINLTFFFVDNNTFDNAVNFTTWSRIIRC
jgi:hypothetical protein